MVELTMYKGVEISIEVVRLADGNWTGSGRVKWQDGKTEHIAPDGRTFPTLALAKASALNVMIAMRQFVNSSRLNSIPCSFSLVIRLLLAPAAHHDG